MESKPNKFRLRLNLFDGIVLILALAAAAFLLWTAMKPGAAQTAEHAGSAATIRYTVLFQRWLEGTSSAIHEGDRLTDSIRNYDMGRVVSAEAFPCQAIRLDNGSRSYVLATMEGYEDVHVVVEAPCVITEEAVTVDGGYAVRVGESVFIQGDGYLATGFVIAMERED